MTSIPVARLNHAVLYVRDLDTAVDFYKGVFGFEEVSRIRSFAAFLRAVGTDNHHDLGLFAVGADAPRPPKGATGLYHLAWEVPRIEDLALAAQVLRDSGALGGASDHGVSKSLYGADPDGNEFEIMWRVPREQWGDLEKEAGIAPLDIEAEVRRHGGTSTAAQSE
jgi:catechol-2,3-dioxygenase